jgi:CrcB protein
MSMFYNILAVFLGGGAGCVLRFLAGGSWGNVLLVNIIGGLLIGVFAAKSDSALKLALTVGFCGGLTTFSAFSLHLFKMIETGQVVQAIAYACASVIICLAAVAAGVYFAKTIF